MSEEENKKHNANFYSIEEVERTLEATKDFEDGEELYYFIGTLRYLYDCNKKQEKEIKRLSKVSVMYDELLCGKNNEVEQLKEKIDKQQKEIIELDELYRDLLKKYNDKESVLDKIKELLEE